MSEPRWYAVVLPGEETPELYGPFRNHDIALGRAAEWNASHDDLDRAYVLPIMGWWSKP